MSGQPLLQDVNAEHGLPAELDVLLLLIAAEGVLVLLVPYLLLLEFRGLLHEMKGKREEGRKREGGRKRGREGHESRTQYIIQTASLQNIVRTLCV